MLNEQDKQLAADLRGEMKFFNPFILGDFVRQLQRFLEFTFELEELDPLLRPKIELSHDKTDDEDTSKSREYEPTLYMRLKKRHPVGENKANEMLINAMNQQTKTYIDVIKHNQHVTDTQFATLTKMISNQQGINVENRMLKNQPLILDHEKLRTHPTFTVFSNKNITIIETQ